MLVGRKFSARKGRGINFGPTAKVQNRLLIWLPQSQQMGGRFRQKTGAVAPALFGAVKLLVNNQTCDF
jgi:hypothetical protein